KPRLDRWRDVINTQFLPLFGSAGEDVEFDYSFPMPLNREQDNAELAAKTLVEAGYDPAAVLEVVGLPAMPAVVTATQAPALPPGWVPGETAPAAAPAGAGDDETAAAAGDGQDAGDGDTPASNLLPWAPFRLGDTRFGKVNGKPLVRWS